MREQGYILPTVLALLLLVAVAAARLDDRVVQYRDAQAAWARWAEVQGELLAAREEVLLAMSTRVLSAMGFGMGADALRVDSRPYRLPSGVLVSVQDLRGLISIANFDHMLLRKFLVRQGVADAEVESLIDKLADYGDTDDLKRLSGAEKAEYAALGLPPPRNDWPISPWELAQVADWHARPGLWRHAGDFFTAIRDGEINPNTAPREVLLTLPRATPESVAMLMRWRETQPLESVEAVAAITGIVLDPNRVSFYPGQFYLIRLWREDEGPGSLTYTIKISPGVARLPWQILETRLIDRPTVPADVEIVSFPRVDAAAVHATRRPSASE